MANILYQSLQPQLEEDFLGDAGAYCVGINSADESLPYSTTELNAPEYATDDFRMFSFKVARCSKRFVHDWRACPFAHPTENARRRDPRLARYLPVPCPDYKRGICLRGDTCSYSHGVYECWLHPAKYRTQLCKEGPHCRRPVCFFAHSVLDLRQPSHLWDGHAGAGAAPEMQAPTVAAGLMRGGGGGGAGVAHHVGHLGPAMGDGYMRAPSPETLNNAAAYVGMQAVRTASAPLAVPGRRSPLPGASSPPRLNGSGAGSGSGSGGEGSTHAANNNNGVSLNGGGIWSSPPHSPSQDNSPNSPPLTPECPGMDLPTHPSGEVLAAMQGAAAFEAAAEAGGSSHGAALPLPPRMSLDSRAAELAAAAAAAAASYAEPPRMSLDSALQAHAGGAGSWGPAPGAASVPVNEQQFAAAGAPRMSNAVARKLGLAPAKGPPEPKAAKPPARPPTAAAALAAAGPVPPGAALDGLLHALHSRPSWEAQMAGMTPQMLAGLASMHSSGMGGVAPGYGHHHPYPPAYGAAGGMGMGMPAPDPLAIHPALLNLMAASMGGPVPNGMHGAQKMSGGMPGGNDAAMAALLSSLSDLNMAGGAPPAQHGGVPPGAAGLPPLGMHHGAMAGHRGSTSLDSMTGVAAPLHALPTPFYLPTDLDVMMNNQAGGGGGALEC